MCSVSVTGLSLWKPLYSAVKFSDSNLDSSSECSTLRPRSNISFSGSFGNYYPHAYSPADALRMTSCIVERRPRYKDANCFHSYWASYWVLVYCSRTDYKGYVRLVGSALFMNRTSSVSAEALSRSRTCALHAVYDRTVED